MKLNVITLALAATAFGSFGASAQTTIIEERRPPVVIERQHRLLLSQRRRRNDPRARQFPRYRLDHDETTGTGPTVIARRAPSKKDLPAKTVSRTDY